MVMGLRTKQNVNKVHVTIFDETSRSSSWFGKIPKNLAETDRGNTISFPRIVAKIQNRENVDDT
jgi:hypothetical protein